jgi:IS4 transposase
MFRISRLHEIMKGLPRGSFDRLVQAHRADKHAKGFGCWDQLVALVYAQLSGANSLRVLESGFNSQGTHHYHLGTGTVRRSTLADALARRQTEVFAETARLLMAQAGRRLKRDGAELLYALDSTSITLKGPGFDAWTGANRTRHTQGIKLHVLYENAAQIPVQHRITAPNVNDIDEGSRLPIEPGAVYVFDKGYCDYSLGSLPEIARNSGTYRGAQLVGPHRSPERAVRHPLQAQCRPRGGKHPADCRGGC